MKKNILAIGMLLFAAYLNAQTVKGYVYNDENHNNKKEGREKGIAMLPLLMVPM